MYLFEFFVAQLFRDYTGWDSNTYHKYEEMSRKQQFLTMADPHLNSGFSTTSGTGIEDMTIFILLVSFIVVGAIIFFKTIRKRRFNNEKKNNKVKHSIERI